MNDRIEAIAALLVEAEQAHGAYESTELGGVYDEKWAAWYAAWAVDHGIGDLIGTPVSADALADDLTRLFADYEAAGAGASESWSSYIARRLVEEA